MLIFLKLLSLMVVDILITSSSGIVWLQLDKEVVFFQLKVQTYIMDLLMDLDQLITLSKCSMLKQQLSKDLDGDG